VNPCAVRMRMAPSLSGHAGYGKIRKSAAATRYSARSHQWREERALLAWQRLCSRRTGDSRNIPRCATSRHTQAPRRHGRDVELGYGELITPRFAPHLGPKRRMSWSRPCALDARLGAAVARCGGAASRCPADAPSARPIDLHIKVRAPGREDYAGARLVEARDLKKAVGSKALKLSSTKSP